jgi:hypothetical protein
VPAAETTPLPDKTRVRINKAIPGVPEGTAGTVRGSVGLVLPRHRVAFDNGQFVTSVTHNQLVRDEEWDAFLATREQEADEAVAEPTGQGPTDAAVPEDTATDEPPADDRLAALLARSKAAREKRAAG